MPLPVLAACGLRLRMSGPITDEASARLQGGPASRYKHNCDIEDINAGRAAPSRRDQSSPLSTHPLRGDESSSTGTSKRPLRFSSCRRALVSASDRTVRRDRPVDVKPAPAVCCATAGAGCGRTSSGDRTSSQSDAPPASRERESKPNRAAPDAPINLQTETTHNSCLSDCSIAATMNLLLTLEDTGPKIAELGYIVAVPKLFDRIRKRRFTRAFEVGVSCRGKSPHCWTDVVARISTTNTRLSFSSS